MERQSIPECSLMQSWLSMGNAVSHVDTPFSYMGEFHVFAGGEQEVVPVDTRLHVLACYAFQYAPQPSFAIGSQGILVFKRYTATQCCKSLKLIPAKSAICQIS